MSVRVDAWKCEKCGKAYLNKAATDDCCKKKPETKHNCRVCGCEVKYPLLICGPCRDKERFAKAKKVKYSEYEIGCLWDESKDEYFDSKESLEEKYIDDAVEGSVAPEFPTWCFGCQEILFVIDIDCAIERAEEEMYEDFEAKREAVGYEELFDFVKEWNQKQTAKSYQVDYKTVVLLNE